MSYFALEKISYFCYYSQLMEKLKNKIIAVLRWSEKYTKTDMTYLARGSFWNILSQIIVSASTLLLSIAFAHFVSKETYGEYKYILSIAGILSAFALSGLSAAVNKSVNQGYEGTLNNIFWKNIKWSVFFMLIAMGLSIYYFVNDNSSLGIAMLIVGSFSPFLNSTNLYNSYLEAKKDFKRSSIYFGIIGNVFPAFCLFISMIFVSKPLWFVVVYFTSNTLIGLILYFRVLKIYRPNKKVDQNALSYSKHLSLMGILSVIIGNIDQVLVFHYIGGAQLAIYNFAVAIPKQIKGPMKGLASLIFPKFSERGDSEIRAGMKNKILWLFLGGVVLITLYILSAPYIFKLLFPKYMDSVLYSQIFSLSLLWIVAIPADTYLSAKRKIKEQYIGNTISPIIQIILLFMGIIWWGLLGLVIARVATSLISSVISIILYEKSSRVS